MMQGLIVVSDIAQWRKMNKTLAQHDHDYHLLNTSEQVTHPLNWQKGSLD